MAILLSASGARVDCDGCGDHVVTSDVTLERLPDNTGYLHIDGRQLCAVCARSAAATSDDTSGAAVGTDAVH